MIAGMLFGAAGGLLIVKAIDTGDTRMITTLIGCVLVFLIASFIAIIIHEGGHLVMGLLTGYRFSSFRVFSWIILKEKGRFVLKRYSIPGTGGQCKLAPPENVDPEDAPYVLYHAGGFIFNFVAAALCAAVCMAVKTAAVRMPMAVLAFVNIYFGIVNAVPMTVGIDNDGKNIVNMRKSPAERAKIYDLLKADALQAGGMTLSEMPESLFGISDTCDSTFESMRYSVYAARLMEQGDYSGASEILRRAVDEPKVAEIMKNEMKCEYIFCLMREGADKEEIDKLYDKDIKAYIRNTQKFYISRRRFLYLYKLLYEKNRSEAEEEYSKFLKMESKYPFSGEYKGEAKIFNELRERFA